MAEQELVTMLCAKNKWRSTRSASSTSLRKREMEIERNIGLLHGLAPGKLAELCLMHLTLMLDLDGDKFQTIAVKRKTPSRWSSRASPFKKKEKRASDGISSEHVSLAFRLITFLKKPEYLKTEGLFRKTGNIVRQRQLKEWLTLHSEDLSEPIAFTAHDCANVLKSTLAELPQPLLTENHFEAYRQASEFSSRGLLDAEQRQLKVMQLLMLLLPRENALIVELLLSLLHQVALESDNKMTASALATIFAPHLLCSKKVEPETFHKDAAIASKSVAFMIEHSPLLFKIPAELATDVETCLQSMKENAEDGQLTPQSIPKDEDSPVRTVISYAHRSGIEDSNPETDTQVALAELFAHVQALPECSRKKKLLKQLNHSTVTPLSKHSRSKTLGSSLKKHLPGFGRFKRLASDDPNLSVDGPPWNAVPVDIEDQSTEKATIINCCKLNVTVEASLCKSLDSKENELSATELKATCTGPQIKSCRRKHSESNEEDDCSPPKQDCIAEKENICVNTHCNTTQKHRSHHRNKNYKSPLPSTENEINYLPVEMRQATLQLKAQQTILMSPGRLSFRPGQKLHCFMPQRPQSVALSPTSHETSL